MQTLRAAIALMLVGSITGCAVGPDFRRPDAPAATRYTTTPLPAETAAASSPGGEAQRLVSGRDIPAEWWTLFECDALDTLVRQALSDSPVLAQARAKLVRAEEEYGRRRGETRYPQIDAGLSGYGVTVEGQELPAVDFPVTLAFATVGVSYSLDLFGRNRRELEALGATVDYQRFEAEASRLMLAGNVVTTAIEQASLKEQIRTIEAAIAVAEKRLEIVDRLERLGGVAAVDVVRQRLDLQQLRASLPGLQERLERTRHRMAVYLGRLPSDAQVPEPSLSDLKLPTELPLSLPSELVRQRPDIQAAEALLHEASARVGMATADLYPKITLSATAGALTVSSLISGVSGFALLGASLTQPIFHGGALKAKRRAAEAAFEQAGGAYREVVLEGFQNVADVLCALDADAKVLRDRAEASAAAKTVFDITTKRYEAGGVSLLQLLDSQRDYLTASIEQVRAVAGRYVDSAALFQALGGGWWSVDASQAASLEQPQKSK